jgi:hypothetical protein
MSFLADRYQQLSDDLAQFDLFKDFQIIISLCRTKSCEDERRTYRNLFDIVYRECPNGLIYLFIQNSERLFAKHKEKRQKL